MSAQNACIALHSVSVVLHISQKYCERQRTITRVITAAEKNILNYITGHISFCYIIILSRFHCVKTVLRIDLIILDKTE